MRVFGLLVLLFSFPLLAKIQMTTQIQEIDFGQHIGDEILVLLKNGRVGKLKRADALILDHMQLKGNQEWFKITMDKNRYITHITNTDSPQQEVVDTYVLNNKSEYIPTTIENMTVAKKYFRELPYNPKDSQCFNRAMVWTYEWWKNHSLKSNKILIFFTRNYIRRYNFEWWFHIAPYVHIKQRDGTIVERAMDRKYSSGPITFRKWTDTFMRNNAECPVITRYSEFADYPYSGECYIIRTNMYTYQPADLQMNEAWGYNKDKFNMLEVKGAYLEAFDISMK